MLKQYIFILLINCLLFSKLAQAEKYCTKGDINKDYVINIFGETFKNDEDRRSFGSGIKKTINKFEMGDRIKIIVFNGSEAVSKIEKCYPGCPKKGLVGNLIDSDCSAVLAKRDKKNMDQYIIEIIKQEVIKSRQDNEYDLFNHLKALDNYYRDRNIANKNIIVFHSLLPYGASGNSSKSFNKAFIKAIENQELSEISIPKSVVFYNANNSRATEKFWKDLQLDGHSKGLKIKFNKVMLD